MKTLLVFALIGSLVPLAKAETLAERAASLVARADSAGIRGELEKKEKEITINLIVNLLFVKICVKKEDKNQN